MERDDAELVRKSQHGDRESFDELVRKHYSLAYNIAYRMLGDEDSAMDAVQLAYVRAYRAIDDFRRDSSFSTWLYSIVNNVCLDYLRERKRSPDSLTDHRDDDAENPRQIDVRDETLDPAGSVQQSETQRLVHNAMLELNHDHRQVLVMYDLGGMSYDRISEILDIPLGTVKSRLNRARHALKQKLQENTELFP